MSGRRIQFLAVAVAAAASLVSGNTASAGCYSNCGFSYAAPVAYYSAPVVYGYSYSAPVSYAAPCANPCGGYASYGYNGYGYNGYGNGYASAPMYVVNQGPAYTEPVVGEPEDTYSYGYRRSHPYYADGGVRWHRRGWHRGYGYRGYGYRGLSYRYGHRHHGYRYGARYSMRHPVVGHGGYRARHAMPYHHMMRRHGMSQQRMHAMPQHRMYGAPKHLNGRPGAVHPIPPK